MRLPRWATCLWPGLPQLWGQGTWAGLAAAVVFSLALNAAIVVTYVWTDWVTGTARAGTWALVALVWLAWAATSTWRSVKPSPAVLADAADDVYSQGLVAYLQGNWFGAEKLFRRLLAADARDADASLMLASTLVRMDRLDEARQNLYQLQKLPESEKWKNEIESELRWLAEESSRSAIDRQGHQESTGKQASVA